MKDVIRKLRFDMQPASEDIIEQLNQLTSIVSGEIPAYVNPSIVEERFDCEFIDGTLVEIPSPMYFPLTKEDFIDKLSTLSLTHTITNISYDTVFGTTVMVDMNVHVVETTDFTTNITPEVMELFYKLPIN